MSSTLRISPRQRWAARSAIVKRWLVEAAITVGEPVCELEVDGTAITISADGLHPEDSPAGIYWLYVKEGEEIGPWGDLLRYTTNASAGPGELRARAALRRRSHYPSIFLNYRRDDADAYAGRLDEAMARAFGREEVFMDEFSIRPGEVFSWTIQQSIVHAKAVISLIGPRWSTITDSQGHGPRITSERDFVRRELVAALDRGIPVLPVLLPGAPLLGQVLSDDLEPLEDLQYHSFSGARHWTTDVETLFAALAEIIK